MGSMQIKQARESDIPALEVILGDAVAWLDAMGQALWSAEEVRWPALSRRHGIGDFHIAYVDGQPAGCMALVEEDPFFWPDVPKGEALYMHKLAVTAAARKRGVADALMAHFKAQGMARGVKTLRLDTHALRPKLRAFYERHGFELVDIRVLMGKYHTAFYVHALPGL